MTAQWAEQAAKQRRVIICAGTGCMANGAMKVFEQFKQRDGRSGLQRDSRTAPERRTTKCACPRADARASARWGRWSRWCRTEFSTPRCAPRTWPKLCDQTLVGGQVVDGCSTRIRRRARAAGASRTIPFYARQNALCAAGMRLSSIPKIFSEYMLHGGYAAAQKGLRGDVAGGDLQDDTGLRPARARRRRFSHRTQMGGGADAELGKEVRHLQRRRRRSRRVHEPLA